MGKDRSEDDILDELRHEDIIEREERIRREHPILVARVSELEEGLKGTKALLSLREDLFEVEKGRVSTLEHRLKLANEEIARLRGVIKATPPPPPPAPAPPTVHPFTPGVCRDCHERILWGLTKNGKGIPLNPKSVVGNMIEWNRELEEELKSRGIQTRQGYDELGDRLTVALVPNPDPLLARVIYPVHFSSCAARNMSAHGRSDQS